MESSSIPFRSHTALLLAAALPHLQPAFRQQAELVLKFLELSETLKFYRKFSLKDEAICGNTSCDTAKDTGISGLIRHFVQDPEALLTKLSVVCTGKESEIVSMLLQFLHAKSFYDTYGDTLQMFLSSGMPSGFTETQTAEETPENVSMQDAASVLNSGNLAAMLNKEQKETLELLKNLLESEE